MGKFNKGDYVCTQENGDGIVRDITNTIFPVVVNFKNGKTCTYLPSGKSIPDNLNPSLFHGKYNDVFSVNEVCPVRTKIAYINLYLSNDGKIRAGRKSYSKSECIDNESQFGTLIASCVKVNFPTKSNELLW